MQSKGKERIKRREKRAIFQGRGLSLEQHEKDANEKRKPIIQALKSTVK